MTAAGSVFKVLESPSHDEPDNDLRVEYTES